MKKIFKEIITIKDKGLPILNTKRFGNLKVKFILETPVKLSGEQKDIMKKFQESLGGISSPKSESFLSKIRKFF